LKLLIDTHAFLWAVENPQRLSADSRRQIENPANTVFVSIASAWELAIKAALTRSAHFPRNVASWFADALEGASFDLLPIELRHVLEVEYLPAHHRDPFDRLLIAQARIENLTIVTEDRAFDAYRVPLLHT